MPFDQQTLHMPKVEAMLEALLAERRAQTGVPELPMVAETLADREPSTVT